MTEKTLTVYEALIEISRLEDKTRTFNDYPQHVSYLSFTTKNAKTISGIDRAKTISLLQGNFDSAKHLISNLAEYKAKVALSNALTKIKIGEKDYTVAEAIQRKNNISTEVTFLNNLKKQLTNVIEIIDRKNKQVEDGLSDYLAKVKSETSTPEDIEKFTNTYYENNKVELVDPNNINENIDVMIEELESFRTNVDTAITASNCSTTITVSLDD